MSAISDLTKAGSGNSGEAVRDEDKSADTSSVNIHSYSPGYIPGPPVAGGPALISSPLPSLGIPDKTASDGSAARRADDGFWKQDGGEIQSSPYSGQMSQAAGVLSSVRNSEEAVNYARSIGQGLLNQKINGWISQYGTGNVSLGSDGRISGDVLLPLYDSPDNVLFSQLGTRKTTNRNIVNVGAGWRHYLNRWMLGLNSFWDYDLTGHNTRLGVGGEAWTDYLKLAANGYFGLTRWHQSVLDAMTDYDERPATGFDLRTEAFLPSYPQLGVTFKYEKYFGKGVDLAGSASADALRNSPSAFSYGLSWTPVPLVTLSATRSSGDDADTRLGVSFTYRPGVPLSHQTDPDYVDLSRSLAGNRYDLVDRNYDIVMQYRKQTLLSIFLPPQVNGHARDTLTLAAVVSRSKYGLRDIDWTVSPSFLADGGTLQRLSSREVRMTLPAYQWARAAAGPQTYTLSAVATDSKGNKSDTATTVISVSPSGNVVKTLTITPDRQIADGKARSLVTARLVASQRQVSSLSEKDGVKGMRVTFSGQRVSEGPGEARSGKLTFMRKDGSGRTEGPLSTDADAQGRAAVMVSASVSGNYRIRALMDNGNYSDSTMTFVADAATAKVAALTVTSDGAKADGRAADGLTVTVTDGNGNPLAGQEVSLAATGGAAVAESVTTGADGTAAVKVTSTKAGASTVTATLGESSRQASVSFVADAATAKVSAVVLNGTAVSKVADGESAFTYTVTVKDGNGNPVTGVTVKPAADKAGVTVKAAGATDAAGQATVTLTSSTLAVADITVSAKLGSTAAVSADRAVSFVADAATAKVSAVVLNGTAVSKVADGESAFTYTVTVKDGNGNPVTGVTVKPAADKAGVTVKAAGATDAAGQATVTLTSSTLAVADITVSAKLGSTAAVSADRAVSFVADAATAKVSAVVLNGTAVSKVADGESAFTYTVTVKDGNGNPVTGVTVKPAADKAGVTVKAAGATDAAGQATVTLTSSTLAVADITVSAKVGSTAAVSADRAVSFVADAATAKVSAVVLNGTAVSKVADGESAFTYTVTVKDGNGNPVTGVTAVPAADKAGVTVKAAGATDAAGQATVTLTSSTLAVADITVSAKLGSTAAVSADRAVSFVADAATAKVSAVVLNGTAVSKVADGESAFTYTVTVKDGNGNPVTGVTVKPAADKAGVTVKAAGATDAAGQATVTLTSSTLAVADITVSAKVGSTAAVSADRAVSFVADAATAKVSAVVLNGTAVSKVADGESAFTYTVTVKDGNGNPVTGVTVKPAADKAGVTVKAAGATDAAGQATVTLTSSTLAVADITVSAKVGSTAAVSADRAVSFVADAATAKVSAVVLNGTAVSKVADGESAFTYTVTVKDGNGNPVTGVTAVPAADKAGVTVKAAGATDAAGQATVTLTSSTLAVADITVSAKLGSTAAVSADRAVSFVADAPSDAKSTFVASPSLVVADGSTISTLTLTLKDVNGNAVTGAASTLNLTVSDSNSVTVSRLDESSEAGIYTANLTGTKGGIFTVKPSYGSRVLGSLNAVVGLYKETFTIEVN
ncbi:Ig-like domain-containing protein [Pantoea sp. JZ2]|nr:Ig-like domain-containing protein [Pantoea sp. JZ2]